MKKKKWNELKNNNNNKKYDAAFIDNNFHNM